MDEAQENDPTVLDACEITEGSRTKRKADWLLHNRSYVQLLRDDIEQAEKKGKRCRTKPDHAVIQLGNMQSTPIPTT